MKLTGTLKVVLDGEIHPTVLNAGDECPKEHLPTAKKLGLIKGHKPPEQLGLEELETKTAELAKREEELETKT